jgi:uncharacterized protein (TIGR00369 family)
MHLNRLLGFKLVRKHKDGVTLECPLRRELLNTAEGLHGGVHATIADAAVGIAVSNHFRGRRKATTVELKVNYLRPILDGKIVARSRLLRAGNTLCTGYVEMFDAHRRLSAIATVTYMLLPEDRA